MVAVGLVAGLGAAVRAATAKGSDPFRRRGRYVYRWVVGCATAGAAVAVIRTYPRGYQFFYQPLGGFLWLGVLIGTAVGNLHALLAVPGDDEPGPAGRHPD